jgi:hypothetical protein
MNATPFEPARYLTKLSGKDYLEVKWRLVWLRDQHADAEIVTECLFADDKIARFVCTITIPSGGVATGHGSETAGDFRDFYEKAETKAIGRALAALGFGTQFTPDHEFGADVGRVVDTPVQRPRAERHNAARLESDKDRPPASTTALISEKQIAYVWGLAGEKGQDDEMVHAAIKHHYGKTSVKELTRADASDLIDRLHAIGPAEQQPKQEPQKGFMGAVEEPDWVRAAPDYTR